MYDFSHKADLFILLFDQVIKCYDGIYKTSWMPHSINFVVTIILSLIIDTQLIPQYQP